MNKLNQMFRQIIKKLFALIKIQFKKEPPINKKKFPTLKQMKYLNEVLSSQEKRNIKILSSIFCISLLILAVRFYFSNSKNVPASGGSYTEGLIGEPKFINPLLAVDDIDISLTRLVYSGLLKYDKDLNLVADLVENFSLAAEQKEYNFCLKKNAFWHDGKKLTIDDVLFTFSLAKNPIFKNSSLDKIKNVQFEQINENCLRVSLEKPSSTFWSSLTLGILPKHIWQNIVPEDFAKSEFSLKPTGSGPYKFSSLARDKQGKIKLYSLEQNKNFYQKPPFIEKINFNFYSDVQESFKALTTKSIDGIVCLPKEIKEKIAEIPDLKNYPINFPYYTAIFFNLRLPTNEKQLNFLREKAVREALAYLTPKQKIFEEVFNQDGLIIHGPILPHSPFYNPEIKKYDYQPSLAEKTLTQAGWKKNNQGFYEKNGQELKISLNTVDQPDFVKTANLIQKSWQEIGLKIKLIIIPPEQIKDIIKTRDFGAFLYGVLENPNFDPFPMWHSSQAESAGLNLTGFNLRRTDELLEKASLTTDVDKKKEYYAEFQEIITNNIPAIFLYNAVYSYLVNEKIKGIEINHLSHPADRFNNIENWYIKTKRQFNNKKEL